MAVCWHAATVRGAAPNGLLQRATLIASGKSATDAPAACAGSAYFCAKLVSTATAQICLNCSDTGSGNAADGTNIELAMMLDLTGSMAGQKILDLIAAAKDL